MRNPTFMMEMKLHVCLMLPTEVQWENKLEFLDLWKDKETTINLRFFFRCCCGEEEDESGYNTECYHRTRV